MDIDYKAELPKDAKIDQNPFIWPKAIFSREQENYDFEYKVHYNEAKLDKVLADSQLTNNVTPPKDAQLVLKDGAFVIEKEVEGNQVDEEKLKKTIIDGINTKQSEIALDDSYYEAPKVRANSKILNDIKEDSQHIAEMHIGFNFNGFDFALEGEELLELFDMEPTGFVLNYDKVREYVEMLASETDTYGTNRLFNATGIGQITVGPGVYGFKLDIDGTIDKIYELVNNRESGDIEPVYASVGFTRTDDGGDIGDTYVEVDISRQYMWFYKDGAIVVESPLVSGIPTEMWASNVGVGAIQNKVQNTVLRGLNFDGASTYDTPVAYWMPIGWDGEGFHDAPWRSSFGGNIYQGNGSHGCFNLPPAVAATLFNNVDFMTPVVVYESSTNNSPAMKY